MGRLVALRKARPHDETDLCRAPAGKGAVYEWQGNSKAGAGPMEIIDATHPDADQARFLQALHRSQYRRFHCPARRRCHRVTWSMEGPAPFVTKLMGLFFNMDKMIGAGLRDRTRPT